MNASGLKKAIKFGYSIKRPLLIASSPGLGKSSIAQQVADELDISFIDIRLSQKAPEEVGSIPYILQGMIKQAKPDWIPTDGAGIIIVDEFMDASLHLQSALLEFILDRKLGGVELGENWYVIACGNRQEDKASAGRLSTAQANRFIHATLEADTTETINFAMINNWSPVVTSFLRFRPELLSKFDPKSKERAFPSPRTWEFVSDILKATPPIDIRYELLTGTVGEGAASELEGFLQVHEELPDVNNIIAFPNKAIIPTEPSILYAVCGLLAHKCVRKNIENIIEYSFRIPPDMSVVLMKDILNKDKTLHNSKGFIKWAEKFGNIVM